jgi:hypothetical protein
MVVMNIEQAKSSIRWFVATFGGVAAGWFAAKGWFTVDQVTSVLTSETTVSLLASIAVGIWGLFVHSKTNAVAVVDAIAKEPDSPVKAVIAESNVAGRDLANSLPGDTTVVAGTPSAMAKAA